MFRLAHLSDPHLGPLPPVAWRDLAGKRLSGYLNWRIGRGPAQDMAVLGALVADVKAQQPDHIAVTGDFANIGLPAEFLAAGRFLEGLGAPDRVSAVPGNHDVYVPGNMAALCAAIGPYMSGDDQRACGFPYLKRRGRVALIGLSTGVPTMPLKASGRLGGKQIAHLETLLDSLARESAIRLVLIHHPPHRGAASRLRHLEDGPALRAAILRHGCEGLLHGHNHRAVLAWMDGPGGAVPVIGAPSASARPGGTHGPGWWLIEVDDQAPAGSALRARLRAPHADGTFGDAPPYLAPAT